MAHRYFANTCISHKFTICKKQLTRKFLCNFNFENFVSEYLASRFKLHSQFLLLARLSV